MRLTLLAVLINFLYTKYPPYPSGIKSKRRHSNHSRLPPPDDVEEVWSATIASGEGDGEGEGDGVD